MLALILTFFLISARQSTQDQIGGSRGGYPAKCSIFVADVINCSRRNLTDVPSAGPNDTWNEALTLRLEDNSIAQIDLNFLNSYPNLERLILRSNNLRSILKGPDGTVAPGDNFGAFHKLVRLDLSSNHLHVLHSFVFAGFLSLKTLNLSRNAIHTISANAFNLPSLETLDLSDNKLEVIGVHFFETSPKLSEIFLSHNFLSRLNERTFGLITNLQLLDLSHNQLMKIEKDVFIGMNISHLDLGYNSFRKVPSLALKRLTGSKTLILDGNQFIILEALSLNQINVEFLSLSHNPALTRIEPDAISSLPVLKTLTINHNQELSYVFPGAIADLPQLVALDLSNNGLFALESEVVTQNKLDSLKALYISGNNFKCHCSLNWINNLHHGKYKIEDLERVQCHPGAQKDELVPASQLDRLTSQCEPYILPLFPVTHEEVMGRNVTWLCKALGSGDLALMWRLPRKSAIVGNSECLGRLCVKDNALTLMYAHPGDSGRYGCVAKNNYGQDQREVQLKIKSEHIQIFPITVSSTFVTLSWNTSNILTTTRGYILRVKENIKKELSSVKHQSSVDNGRPSSWQEQQQQQQQQQQLQQGTGGDIGQMRLVKEYEDIDVGLKMNSYTVNELLPGHTYVFELCLKKAQYVIPISWAKLTTKDGDFENELGIETDYVTLFVVAIVLTGLITTCVVTSVVRMVRFHHVFYKKNCAHNISDTSSQREMIVSPSDHSSVMNAGVSCSNSAGASGSNFGAGGTAGGISICNRSILSGDQSRLVDNEVTSPVDETTMA